MLIKSDFMQNQFVKRFFQHISYLSIVAILIPGFLIFEVCIVLPTVVEQWTIGYCIHLLCAAYLLLNIVGNLMFGMFTNSSIKGRILNPNKEDWSFCSVCECLRPPRAWHCDFCNICILKRDHHCAFFACCVGYYNHRYFMLFMFYIFVSMVYAFYFNVIFLSKFIAWNHGFVIVKFVFPLFSFVFDFGEETVYIFLVVINFVVALFSGFLFLYHLKNIFGGQVTPEMKGIGISYDRGLKLNLIEVFGSRWYLTWVTPFVSSPLPGDGTKWQFLDKHK